MRSLLCAGPRQTIIGVPCPNFFPLNDNNCLAADNVPTNRLLINEPHGCLLAVGREPFHRELRLWGISTVAFLNIEREPEEAFFPTPVLSFSFEREKLE